MRIGGVGAQHVRLKNLQDESGTQMYPDHYQFVSKSSFFQFMENQVMPTPKYSTYVYH